MRIVKIVSFPYEKPKIDKRLDPSVNIENIKNLDILFEYDYSKLDEMLADDKDIVKDDDIIDPDVVGLDLKFLDED